MCEFLALNQKINLLSENIDKAVKHMKVRNRNVDFFHEDNKILQNELALKNKIIQLLMET